MSAVQWGFDLAVVALLLGLAVRIMTTRNLFEATVLFIAFGLSLALAWVRLGAADLALAEAALGAGVTGALFLNAFRRLAWKDRAGAGVGEWRRAVPEALRPAGPAVPAVRPPRSRGAGPRRGPPRGWQDPEDIEIGSSEAPDADLDPGVRRGPLWLRAGLAVAALGTVSGLVALLLTLPDRPPLLPAMVAERLGESGVENPVTAVLLNFRAYDTLLEVGVLVVAMVAVWSLDRGSRDFVRDPEDPAEEPMLAAIARFVVPLAGVTAVYLTWAGSHATGGAFQAGALLAGAGVLLTAAGLVRPVTSAAPLVRALGVLGLAGFTAVGLAVMPWTGVFLGYPAGAEYGIILAVEGVIALSIAVVLVELFVDVPAVPPADPALARVDPTGDPLGRTASPDGALIRAADEES